MENILREPLSSYLIERKKNFAANQLAQKLRHDFPNLIMEVIQDKVRYKVVGSPGKGNWSECPWIAMLDLLVTESPQSGYYPVLLFRADMSGVYLSLNQGVTEVKDYYKSDTKDVLKLRASGFRAKLSINQSAYVKEIDLRSSSSNAKLYEAGNIIAKYYPSDDLPNSDIFKNDILTFINLYDDLTFNDLQMPETNGITAIERKQYRLHFRIERNSNISKKVKAIKGYTCEVCDFDFQTKYGDLGKKFIEAHHLTPISTLEIGTYKLNIVDDFAVLCSNCHSMIHRLGNRSKLEDLKSIIFQ